MHLANRATMCIFCRALAYFQAVVCKGILFFFNSKMKIPTQRKNIQNASQQNTVTPRKRTGAFKRLEKK